jgi:hypothetical protein
MGIEHKHAYRFVFLRSDKWKNTRLKALAREDAKCQICGVRALDNDAHHVFYPKSIWDTHEDDLVILCRPCHDFAHKLFKKCPTRKSSMKAFVGFVDSIRAWISQRRKWAHGIVSDSTPMLIQEDKTSESVRCKLCYCISASLSQENIGKMFTMPRISVDWKIMVCPSCREELKKVKCPNFAEDRQFFIFFRKWGESRKREK